jgi:hypothetical protein
LNYSNLFPREKEKEYCANGPLRLMASACQIQWAGGPVAEKGELPPPMEAVGATGQIQQAGGLGPVGEVVRSTKAWW